jgi:hypothetical protein
MKRVVWMGVLLILALPMAAFASSIDFGNFGGSVSGSASGLTVSSTLMTVTGLSGGPFNGPNLGTVTINVGCPAGGCTSTLLANGGTFGSGTITITSNGSGGLTAGTLFSGTFSSATWTLEPFTVGGNHEYVLTIGFAGGNGSTFQVAIVTGKGFFNGTGDIESGDTTVVVPEPGTLGLLGTGLVGVAGLVRRKLKCG